MIGHAAHCLSEARITVMHSHQTHRKHHRFITSLVVGCLFFVATDARSQEALAQDPNAQALTQESAIAPAAIPAPPVAEGSGATAPNGQLPSATLPSADAIRREVDQIRADKVKNVERLPIIRQTVADKARENEQLLIKQVEIARQIQSAEADLTTLDDRLAVLTKEETEQRQFVATKRAALVKLLGALQRMGRDPPPVIITRRDDALRMVRSALLLSAVYPELRDKALELQRRLAAFDLILREAKDKRQQQTTLAASLGVEQRRLDALIAANKQETEKLVSEYASVSEKVDQLIRNEADLTGALNLVVAEVESQLPLRSTLAKGDEALAESAPTLVVADASNAVPGAENPVSASKPLASAGLDLARGRPLKRFDSYKGSMSQPVVGRRVLRFGDIARNGLRMKGEAYLTRDNALIRTPCDGWIVYAGEFRSYGQLLIINAGGDYHILLAGLSQVDVTMGQFVMAGQPVGKMGGRRASSNDQAPYRSSPFYVEFRHKEQPINPAPWWSVESEKVQG
jgi:murein hydrolase activator